MATTSDLVTVFPAGGAGWVRVMARGPRGQDVLRAPDGSTWTWTADVGRAEARVEGCDGLYLVRVDVDRFQRLRERSEHRMVRREAARRKRA